MQKLDKLFLCHPTCTTCKKARAFLDAAGLAYTERDIRHNKPSAAELRAWHKASGLPLRRFFNTSGALYRELGLSAKLPSMSEDEQIALLSLDGMLVRRPILVHDGGVLVGFSQAAWEEALITS